MKHLRDLLGDNWVKTEILGPAPSHLLGLWQKKDPENPLVPYVDSLLDFILNSGQVKHDRVRLGCKVKADFAPTLVELGYAAFLGKQGFRVTMEPCAPNEGPDLMAVSKSAYYAEIRKVGLDEAAGAFEQATEQVFERLRNVPSRYTIFISMTEDYAAHSSKLRRAMEEVERTLCELRERPVQKASLYLSGADCYALEENGETEPEYDYEDPVKLAIQVQKHDIRKNSPFVAQFTDSGKENDHTVVGTLPLGSHPLETKPDQSYLRLRRILAKKRTQLPKGSRGIIVLDLTDLWMLGLETIERALYGDLKIHFQRDTNGSVKDETTLNHAANGFFINTSRVSAVVVENMKIGRTIEVVRLVYPTNNESATVLARAELCCFGELQEHLAHLSADKSSSSATLSTESLSRED